MLREVVWRRCRPACSMNLRASCCEEMGAGVGLAIRSFNLGSRAEREISKMKPSPIPMHPSTQSLLREISRRPEFKGEIARKDDKLLSLLKDIYVESKNPVPSEQIKDAGRHQEPKEFRVHKHHRFDMMNIKNIPKGKISIVEALTLLNNNKLYPEMTAEKIAQEYHLELKDVNALLRYFVTFVVKVFTPEDKNAIQSK